MHSVLLHKHQTGFFHELKRDQCTELESLLLRSLNVRCIFEFEEAQESIEDNRPEKENMGEMSLIRKMWIWSSGEL